MPVDTYRFMEMNGKNIWRQIFPHDDDLEPIITRCTRGNINYCSYTGRGYLTKHESNKINENKKSAETLKKWMEENKNKLPVLDIQELTQCIKDWHDRGWTD